ncbi:MAG: tetratricopeptide repeat protein [Flammeovirgaceae bacterium]|nr:tetratricopeptide repeat protein [Flammeovirgaceae bacterium]
MGKVILFPGQGPQKYGFKPVKKRRQSAMEKRGQLNLFSGGRVVSLNKLSLFEEALLLDEQGDKEAGQTYLKAIEQGDSVADAYCNLGILESEAKNHSKAIDYFTLSLKEDPRHCESHYNLANVYAEIGDLPLAKIHYQLAIAIDPEFPNTYFNLGLTQALNKEFREAIQSLHQYKKLVPRHEHLTADELIASLST